MQKPKNFLDYIAIALTTFGVGFIPIAPGTFGSMVGVGIYILAAVFESSVSANLLQDGWTSEKITAYIHALNVVLFLMLTLIGFWAAGRSTELFKDKDPSQAVVDEIIGQLITFLFIPFTFSWKYILAGFLLFRLFDIWKPYPIDYLQGLPTGIGVCADDILAGVYAGTCLSIFYAVTFF